MKWDFLSYSIDSYTPCFGGVREFERKPRSKISNNNSSNSEYWLLSNHMGTHIDAPLHFADGAKSITDYPAEFWHFNNIHLLDIKVDRDQLISEGDRLDEVNKKCELLLVRTGFEEYRNTEVYWRHNPGIAAAFANTLRESLPFMRAIGFDFISLTAFQHREEGRAAHRAFLNHERPILIIEDMKLSGLTCNPSVVIVSPLLVEGSDGSPVTVFSGT